MRNIVVYILLFFTFLLFSTKDGQSQNYSLQLYDFNNVAQTTLLNPATHVQSDFTFGLAHVGLNANMPNLNLADVFARDNNLYTTVDNFLMNNTKSLNNITFALQAGTFIGFRLLQKNYISLGVYADANLVTSIPKDGLNLFWNGSQPYTDQTLNIGPKLFGDLHLVYHLGYSRQINKKLNLGIRVKLLTGVQNIRTPHTKLQLRLEDDPLFTYRYSLSSNYEVQYNNENFINGTQKKDVISYLFDNGINGFGLDLGFEYKINKKWSISASVLDLGFVDWSSDVIRLHKRGTDVDIAGIGFSTLTTFVNISSSFGERLDSIIDIVGFDTSYNFYTSTLKSKFYLGTEYHFSPVTKASATFFGHFDYSRFNYAFGLSVSHKLWSVFDLRLGWNMYNNSFDNVGLGFSINMGYFQIYAMTENIISAFSYDQAHRFNFQIGVNINLGLNLDKDKDGVSNKKDKCVNIFGLEEFDGCPDTDKDSVPDYKDSCRLDSGAVSNFGCPLNLDRDGDSVLNENDSCPNIKGLKTAFGCPDQDEDGVPDYKDTCIDIKGVTIANGCPDKDGDGIADKEDSCISIAGRKEFYGCPTQEKLLQSRFDSDGDGTPDSLDLCPNFAGSELLNGCPDYDYDGVPDNQDSCIELAGELEFNGCPDTDGDKVPDYLDACITLTGTTENNGCPVSISPSSSIMNQRGGADDNDYSPTGGAANQNQVVKNIALNPDQSRVLVEAFSNLEFKFQSSTILQNSYGVLDNLAALLQSKPDAKLILIGYTDNIGDESFNQTLSYRRATSVKNYLINQGGVKNQIDLYGFGENNPIATNNTSEGRARNRRVEMAILEK